MTNPVRATLEKKLESARTVRVRLVEHSLELVPGKAIRVGRGAVTKEELDQLIHDRDAEITKTAIRVADLPKKVPLDTVLEPRAIVQLERERKVLVDAFKLTAYRAESALARVVEPFFARHEDEARKFLRSVFQATADIIPDRRNRRLTVRFHGLASPRATLALRGLCDLINDDGRTYPGTDLRLHFEVQVSQE